jgi:hypothetical protein
LVNKTYIYLSLALLALIIVLTIYICNRETCWEEKKSYYFIVIKETKCRKICSDKVYVKERDISFESDKFLEFILRKRIPLPKPKK